MKTLDNNNCPVCGSSLIEGADFEIDSKTTAYQEMSCGECGSTWNDFYDLKAQSDIVPGPGYDEET